MPPGRGHDRPCRQDGLYALSVLAKRRHPSRKTILSYRAASPSATPHPPPTGAYQAVKTAVGPVNYRGLSGRQATTLREGSRATGLALVTVFATFDPIRPWLSDSDVFLLTPVSLLTRVVAGGSEKRGQAGCESPFRHLSHAEERSAV